MRWLQQANFSNCLAAVFRNGTIRLMDIFDVYVSGFVLELMVLLDAYFIIIQLWRRLKNRIFCALLLFCICSFFVPWWASVTVLISRMIQIKVDSLVFEDKDPITWRLTIHRPKNNRYCILCWWKYLKIVRGAKYERETDEEAREPGFSAINLVWNPCESLGCAQGQRNQ